MSIAPATPADLAYIVSLSKKHAEELGFLTKAALQAYVDRGRVTIHRENGDPTGYFLIGASTNNVRIFQACVQMDARGLHHGLALLSSLVTRAALSGLTSIDLHCRDTLASNAFWSACGFEHHALLCGGRARKRILHEWRLPIRAALSNPTLPYARSFLAALRSGPHQGTFSP